MIVVILRGLLTGQNVVQDTTGSQDTTGRTQLGGYGTSGGAEADMLNDILGKAGFILREVIKILLSTAVQSRTVRTTAPKLCT